MKQLFTWLPDYNAKESTSPKLKETKFGDGYEQASADGMNFQLRRWSVSFSNRSREEIEAIRDFLATHGGHTSFEFDVPDATIPERVWVKCKKWDRAFTGWRTQQAQFEFEESVV